MGTFQRLANSISQLGPWATTIKFYMIAVDCYFDIRYGTDTRALAKLDALTIEGDNKAKGIDYQATRVVLLRRVFHHIRNMLPADGLFVDFGCGKGRVLLIASQFGFKEVRGVEFAHELCEIAKTNCDVYKAKTAVRTEFQVIESDAAEYVIDTDENVFFMFNPFDQVVLQSVVNNISASLKIKPRKVLIIYYNPKHGDFITEHADFIKSNDFVLWGYHFAVYSNGNHLT